MTKRGIILTYLTLLLLSQCVLSLKIPTYISFQGKLSNSSNGDAYYPASVRLTITNQSQLTQAEWGPYTYNDVTDSQGVFSIVLGRANQLNLTPGWQYQLKAEVDINSATFNTADLTFGDLNPSGDSIIITGGGPKDASEILTTDNVTTVQAALDNAATGDITAVTTAAESGLQGGTDTGPTTLALRTCSNGQVLKNQSGGWACAADDGGTTYTALLEGGLNLTGSAFHLTNLCTPNQILKNQTGGWTCANDADTTYTAGASGGLELSGTVFRLLSTCSDGQILKNQSGGWICAADATGSTAPEVISNITALQANATALWTNATNQDARIKTTEDRFGTLTNGMWCTGTATGFQCTSSAPGTAVEVIANITALQANASDLYTNATGQNARMLAIESAGYITGVPVAYVTNITALQANASDLYTNATGQNVRIADLYTNATGQNARMATFVCAIGGGTSSVLCSGATNTAAGKYASNLGGSTNTASGENATTAGGAGNIASGAYSFAAGKDVNVNQASAMGLGRNITVDKADTLGVGFAQNMTIFVNATKLVITDNKVLCFGTNCNVCMYWNSTALVQESPCTR
ncbi:MAG: hypothetical protein V1875_10395 [Candidatus Altiarchaeota archaeon]